MKSDKIGVGKEAGFAGDKWYDYDQNDNVVNSVAWNNSGHKDGGNDEGASRLKAVNWSNDSLNIADVEWVRAEISRLIDESDR